MFVACSCEAIAKNFVTSASGFLGAVFGKGVQALWASSVSSALLPLRRVRIKYAPRYCATSLVKNVGRGLDAAYRPLSMPVGRRDDRQDVRDPVVQFFTQPPSSLFPTPLFPYVLNQSGAMSPVAGVFAQNYVGPLGEMPAALGMNLAPDQLEGRSSRSLAIILSLMGNRSDGTNAWQPNGDGIFTFGRADDFARAAKKGHRTSRGGQS